MSDLWIFVAILFGIALTLRGNFVFSLLYFIVGVYGIGLWWSKRGFENLKYQRFFEPQSFLGDEVNVRVLVQNQGLLPIPWVRLRESLPVELSSQKPINQVISLGPHGRVMINYSLRARKRGYYPVGPLFTYAGDLLGITNGQQGKSAVDYLTIFPKIIPLTNLKLSSRSPQDILPSNQAIFEDPARIFGKRAYVAGDSMRLIDWKATAILGRLQVKQFEPSIALETSIFLNLNANDYDARHRIDSTELAIVIAASLASWIIKKKQPVGLLTNGRDSIDPYQRVKLIPPRKGRGHLTQILRILARLQLVEDDTVATLMKFEGIRFSWGSTLVIITGKANDKVFEAVFQLQKRGMNTVIILAGRNPEAQVALQKASYFGIQAFAFKDEHDFEIWRQ